jgi:hypothetical protein
MANYKGFDKEYDQEAVVEGPTGGNFIDSDREYPIETRCCITGDATKHSFCRYPDPVRGTMMVMTHDVMLSFSREGESLSAEFERVLGLRRKYESRK